MRDQLGIKGHSVSWYKQNPLLRNGTAFPKTKGVAATVAQSGGSIGVVDVFSPTSSQISFLTFVAGALSDTAGDVYLNFVF